MLLHTLSTQPIPEIFTLKTCTHFPYSLYCDETAFGGCFFSDFPDPLDYLFSKRLIESHFQAAASMGNTHFQ